MLKQVKFGMGQLVSTPGALEFMERNHISPFELVQRHVTGDWGDLSDEDKRENDFSVEKGYRILSSYKFGDEKLWVITEADRSATTILLPEEY